MTSAWGTRPRSATVSPWLRAHSRTAWVSGLPLPDPLPLPLADPLVAALPRGLRPPVRRAWPTYSASVSRRRAAFVGGQVDHELDPVEGEGHGLVGLLTVEVVDQLENGLLRHKVLRMGM